MRTSAIVDKMNIILSTIPRVRDVCGTLKCENAAICEKVAKCENSSTLNVKIDAIYEKNNAKCEKNEAL